MHVQIGAIQYLFPETYYQWRKEGMNTILGIPDRVIMASICQGVQNDVSKNPPSQKPVKSQELWWISSVEQEFRHHLLDPKFQVTNLSFPEGASPAGVGR